MKRFGKVSLRFPALYELSTQQQENIWINFSSSIKRLQAKPKVSDLIKNNIFLIPPVFLQIESIHDNEHFKQILA